MKKTELRIKLLNLSRELVQLKAAYEMTSVPSTKISLSNKIIMLQNKIYRTSLYI